jgi:cell surface protein SprA
LKNIATRLEDEERKKWETLGYAYELKDKKLGLGDLIKNLTDFEIPLPSVGVLSIFGTPKISLKIGGSVQIHGAWRSETTEGVTASRLGNTRNEPDFKQQVQINVNGTIGDKLNIVADWNTERTFEYENQLKIKYTGYEDEIIQSIEAGNVSLQTSPLVGGSEALFGIKAMFKMGPFSLNHNCQPEKR